MSHNLHLSFENTALAFASKSNAELKKAYYLFLIMNQSWLVDLGTRIISMALYLHLPVKFLIKKTVFNLFCGGESISGTRSTIDKLAQSNIQTILDFSVEGEESEAEFAKVASEQLKIIDYAAQSSHMPFSVLKVSGIASNTLLAKLKRGEELNASEQKAYQAVKERVRSICKRSYELDVRLMIDAEESWIQEPIDTITYEMMVLYNKEKPVIWNTFQLYRHDMMEKLQNAFEEAKAQNYWLGAKLVRGAYMEKERQVAKNKGRQDPIHPTKEATDKAYNAGIRFCIDNRDRIGLFAGTHNDQSSQYLAEMIHSLGIAKDHPNLWFGQLFGMSDHISYSLALAGFNVAKYVPYGPVEKVMPYLFRRAEENKAMAGQSSREYRLVRQELKRRKSKIEVC